MTRFLIDGLAIAALALTMLAAPPARADGGRELAGLFLGIGTVYAIGKGIERARAPAPVAETVPERIRDPHRLAPGYGFGYGWSVPARTLPRDCLATFDTWHGEIRGFGADCLARHMPRADRLPAICAIDTRIGESYATIFSARCLQLEGWAVGRRADAGWHAGPRWRDGSRFGP